MAIVIANLCCAICVFDANGLLQVEGRFIIPLISRKNEVICINIAFCAFFNLIDCPIKQVVSHPKFLKMPAAKVIS